MGEIIRTVHETALTLNPNNRLVHSAIHDPRKLPEIQAYFHEDLPYLLLESARSSTFPLTSNGPRSHTHIARVQHAADGRFSILDVWSRMYLSSRPVSRAGGRIESRDKVSDWELFHSEGQTRLPERLKEVSRLLSKERLAAEDILHVIEHQTGPSADRVISCLLPLLELAEVELLGKEILQNRELLEKLEGIFKDDLWIHHALPLLDPQTDHGRHPERSERKRTLSRDFDHLGTAGKRGVSEGAGHVLNAAARRAVAPDRLACVVATARNEGIYLLEWVAYHRAIGFEEIILYSNNNTDQSDALLAALADAGQIIWYNNTLDPKSDAQGKAYGHALTVQPDILDFRWCAFIDIDEFICINTDLFSGLADFLKWHDRCQTDAIALNWVYFGSDGTSRWRDAPITERLTARDVSANAHIKTIFRPHKAMSSQPHFPREGERYAMLFRGSDSGLHTHHESTLSPEIAKALADRPTDTHAFVAHFFYKSCEEFLWKFSRNRGDYQMTEQDIALTLEPRFLKGFLDQFNTKKAVQHLGSSNAAFTAEYNRLLDNPQVAAAAETVKSAFRERSQRVMEMYREFLSSEMGAAGHRFLELLDAECVSPG